MNIDLNKEQLSNIVRLLELSTKAYEADMGLTVVVGLITGDVTKEQAEKFKDQVAMLHDAHDKCAAALAAIPTPTNVN